MGRITFLGNFTICDNNEAEADADVINKLWADYQASVKDLIIDEYPLLWKFKDEKLSPNMDYEDHRTGCDGGGWFLWLDHIRKNFIVKHDLSVVYGAMVFQECDGILWSGILCLTEKQVTTYTVGDLDIDYQPPTMVIHKQ